MKIYINETPTELPQNCDSLSSLVAWKKISPQGTAIAVNDRLIKQSQWENTKIKDNDHLTVISAAFGG